ncbi:MAG TPA: hypothetical protein VK166_08850 [Chitinophagaceae bacterium]|nr:hypothetical protein [Chitinophagaceae bacterium]
MFWLLGLLMLILLLITWLMTAPLEMKLDTRIPAAELTWKTIARARVWYEHAWLIRFRIFFFSKTVRLTELKRSPGKAKKVTARKSKPSRLKNMPGRFLNVVRSFTVTECTLAMDTGDYTTNARLYFLNYAPLTRGHLFMNFNDENYLVLKIRNRPWKIIFAFFRRSIV